MSRTVAGLAVACALSAAMPALAQAEADMVASVDPDRGAIKRAIRSIATGVENDRLECNPAASEVSPMVRTRDS